MRRKIIPYNPKLKQRARYLRTHSTLAEVILWQYLKGKQMKGYDFHRQKPIDNYIIDFFCPGLLLAIEIDGCSHDETKIDYDYYRQKRLESFGIRFLRFKDSDVKQNIEAVLMRICEWIDEYERRNKKPTPNTPSATFQEESNREEKPTPKSPPKRGLKEGINHF